MRKLLQVFDAQETHDGEGVKIHRIAGRRLKAILNPFLMIDEFNSETLDDYIGGFPEHPHRGFETITYMKEGRVRHKDHMGNEGVIGPGDIQWMTAGAGVLHSEMPEQEKGLMHGFQIWLNLPANEKMQPASYKDISSESFKEHQLSDGANSLRVIAGNIVINENEYRGQIKDKATQPLLVDLQLGPNETIDLVFEESNSALVYVYNGRTNDINFRQLGLYAKGKELRIKTSAIGAKLLLLSGKKIEEPIVQHGPFVMNSHEEIKKAISDFQNQNYLNSL